MIHPNDYSAMEKMFGNSDLPEDVRREYAVVRKMADAYGHSGALGLNLVIPMLRRLGYGKIVEKPVQNVDWRNEMGARVVAQYGDVLAEGVLSGLGMNGRLWVALDEYGEVEVPRYSVKLKAEAALSTEKSVWDAVEEGAAVIVHREDKDVNGRFLGVSDTGLRVRLGPKEFVYPSDVVELKS